MINNQQYKWYGEWWIHSDENPNSQRIYGTLSFDVNGQPILELPPSKSYELNCKFGHSYTIWGEDVYGTKITLLKTYLKSQNIADCFVVSYALIGKHVTSLESSVFLKAIAKYPNLKEFFYVQHIDITPDVNYTSIKISYPTTNEFKVPIDNDINWILKGNCDLHVTRRFLNVDLNQDSAFIIESESVHSLGFFLQQIREFSDFLSLALQGKQCVNQISFYEKPDNDEKCDLYFLYENSAKCKCHLIGDSTRIERLTDIFKNWHKNYRNIAPIYSYLERSAYDNHGISGIPEFLLVEAAVEGFFKRFHDKVKRKKGVRICLIEFNKLLEYYKDVELIRTLNLDLEAVVNTRDAYVHLYPESEYKGNELRDPHDIWMATEKLRILLLCCLLDSLGFTKQEIDTNFKTAPIYNPDMYKNEFLFE